MDAKHNRNGMDGKLPAYAPLANPYVPFQMDNPPKYEPRQALVKGTLFPGLDLPFMGMVNKNEQPVTPLSDLQTMAFIIQELALYLDTHRNDEEALSVYRSFQKMYDNAAKAYAKEYGPLTHFDLTDGPYAWLNDPWPWEYAKNKEG